MRARVLHDNHIARDSSSFLTMGNEASSSSSTTSALLSRISTGRPLLRLPGLSHSVRGYDSMSLYSMSSFCLASLARMMSSDTEKRLIQSWVLYAIDPYDTPTFYFEFVGPSDEETTNLAIEFAERFLVVLTRRLSAVFDHILPSRSDRRVRGEELLVWSCSDHAIILADLSDGERASFLKAWDDSIWRVIDHGAQSTHTLRSIDMSLATHSPDAWPFVEFSETTTDRAMDRLRESTPRMNPWRSFSGDDDDVSIPCRELDEIWTEVYEDDVPTGIVVQAYEFWRVHGVAPRRLLNDESK